MKTICCTTVSPGSVALLILFSSTTLFAEDRRQRSSRTTSEKVPVVQSVGNFLFNATRRLEKSLSVDEPYSGRVSRTSSTWNSSRTLPAKSGLPDKVVLTSKSASPSTQIIYQAPQTSNIDVLHTDNIYATESRPIAPDNSLVAVTPTPPVTIIEPPKPKPLNREELPVASRTSNSNRVISPYPPHRELDVTGLSPRSLARDPGVGKVFIVP